MTIQGRCSCQSVQYSLSREPIFTHACHCLLCQRNTASVMVIHSLLEAGHFHLTSGQLEAWAGQTGSGKGQEIFRCSQCGDQIYSIYHRRSGLLLVKTATFDQREDFPPQAHIFTRSKVSWIELADGQPIFEAGYDRDVLYDPDSLARVRLATGQMAGK